MKEEQIRKFSGEIIGMIETDDKGNKVVRSFPSRQILGFYKKQYDYTTNFAGIVISKGDCLVSLLYNPEYNKDLKKA